MQLLDRVALLADHPADQFVLDADVEHAVDVDRRHLVRGEPHVDNRVTTADRIVGLGGWVDHATWMGRGILGERRRRKMARVHRSGPARLLDERLAPMAVLTLGDLDHQPFFAARYLVPVPGDRKDLVLAPRERKLRQRVKETPQHAHEG